MQIKSLRIKPYRSWTINDTSSAEAIKRLKKLELYEQLKTEGCSSATCLIAIDWSKATYYRWLKRYQEQGIPLFVLPPRKPKWNGCVERANGTTGYEFYPFYEGSLTVAAVNKALADYQQYYHHYRPHDG